MHRGGPGPSPAPGGPQGTWTPSSIQGAPEWVTYQTIVNELAHCANEKRRYRLLEDAMGAAPSKQTKVSEAYNVINLGLRVMQRRAREGSTTITQKDVDKLIGKTGACAVGYPFQSTKKGSTGDVYVFEIMPAKCADEDSNSPGPELAKAKWEVFREHYEPKSPEAWEAIHHAQFERARKIVEGIGLLLAVDGWLEDDYGELDPKLRNSLQRATHSAQG